MFVLNKANFASTKVPWPFSCEEFLVIKFLIFSFLTRKCHAYSQTLLRVLYYIAATIKSHFLFSLFFSGTYEWVTKNWGKDIYHQEGFFLFIIQKWINLKKESRKLLLDAFYIEQYKKNGISSRNRLFDGLTKAQNKTQLDSSFEIFKI